MLRSKLCDSNDAYIVLKGTITVTKPYNVGDGEEGFDANKFAKKETENVIPLKHLSNYWRSLNILLINCEVELILNWSKKCVLADMTVRDAKGDNPEIVASARLEFQITDTKLFLYQKKPT